MDNLKKRKDPRFQGFDYNIGTYFITICTKERKCILSRVLAEDTSDGVSLKLTGYGEIAEKYLRQLNDFYDHISVEDYVIMPNHIHILLMVKGEEQRLPQNDDRANSEYSRFVSTFKRFCNKECGGNIWQNRSNDHIIRNRKDYEEHLRYIYENPIRWHFDELYTEM